MTLYDKATTSYRERHMLEGARPLFALGRQVCRPFLFLDSRERELKKRLWIEGEEN